MSVVGINALVFSTVQIILLVIYARRGRRALRVRRNEIGTIARPIFTRPVVALTFAHGIHLLFTETLLSRWMKKAVRRAETRAAPRAPSLTVLTT